MIVNPDVWRRPTRLRRDGEDWVLTFEGRSTRLRHSKGLTQLAALLANPGQEISAVELAGGIDSSARTPVLDESAKRAYRQRLAELDEALRLADVHGDAASARRREAERAALVAELKRATGLAGRSRAFSDDAERARVNVTRTVRQALDRILAADPDTGRHLLGAVRTGTRCIYQPTATEHLCSSRTKASRSRHRTRRQPMRSSINPRVTERPRSPAAADRSAPLRVDLFVDPACWWSCQTYQWLVTVVPVRSLDVHLRPYSLLLRNGSHGLQDWQVAVWGASLRAARVMQAMDEQDPAGLHRFYTALIADGAAAFHAGRPPFAGTQCANEEEGC